MMKQEMNVKKRFYILVAIVAISGFSQGMLLPLISVIFEQDGLSVTLNGLNATGLYIGTLLISPFMEAPLRRFGYKPVIIVGGMLVFLSLLLFPLWKSVTFWFVLRLLIGIGDHALHFATQTWITSTSPEKQLGKNIAIYGLSFGAGFAVGPLLVNLIHIFEGLPFIVSGILCMLAWSLVFKVDNDFPEHTTGSTSTSGSFKRFAVTTKVAWFALLPGFGYGFLESSLNAIYPVYALRTSIDVSMLSLIISAFSIGGLVTQIPLGHLSDRFGRRNVLLTVLSIGSLIFFLASFYESNAWFIATFFLVAGMFIGSTFSLGIAYMADTTPREMLPTGNLLCGIFFSLGSLSGPFLGGLFLELANGLSFFILIASVLFVIFLLLVLGGKKQNTMIQS